MVGESAGKVCPPLLVLTCCHSVKLAEHVGPYVGMCISTESALNMAQVHFYVLALYEGLLGEGNSIEVAHRFACAAMENEPRDVQKCVRAPRFAGKALCRVEATAERCTLDLSRGKGRLYRMDPQTTKVCDQNTRVVQLCSLYEKQLKRWFSKVMAHPVFLQCASVGEKKSFPQISSRVTRIVGWPGFGKTELCRRMIEVAEEEFPEFILFYVPWSKEASGASWFSNYLNEQLGIDDEDTRIIMENVQEERLLPLWLLDDFKGEVPETVTQWGYRVELSNNKLRSFDYYLGPSHECHTVWDAMTSVPNKGASVYPLELMQAVAGGGTVWSGDLHYMLRHHPLWVGWLYDTKRSVDMEHNAETGGEWMDIDPLGDEALHKARSVLERTVPSPRWSVCWLNARILVPIFLFFALLIFSMLGFLEIQAYADSHFGYVVVQGVTMIAMERQSGLYVLLSVTLNDELMAARPTYDMINASLPLKYLVNESYVSVGANWINVEQARNVTWAQYWRLPEVILKDGYLFKQWASSRIRQVIYVLVASVLLVCFICSLWSFCCKRQRKRVGSTGLV